MKFLCHNPPEKIQFPMAPLVAVMFLLLMFFMLHLRIVVPEDDFANNLPLSAPQHLLRADVNLQDIKVGLRSDRDGNLTHLMLGSKDLGHDEAAFERLNREILQIIGRSGNPQAKDVEVEIDADFETQHRDVVKAISQCTGRMDGKTRQLARFVEKIKFAPPRKPKV